LPVFPGTASFQEEHLKVGRVTIHGPVRASSMVGSCEDGVPPDSVVVEEVGIERGEEVPLAGKQVTDAQSEHAFLVP
jgi:hypothetical protein